MRADPSTSPDRLSRLVSQPPDSRAARRTDVAGSVLAVVAAVWVLIVAGRVDGARPGPVVALVAGIVAAVLLGRLVTRWHPLLVPATATMVIAITLLLAGPDLRGPAGSPLGYANANATLAALGALAAFGAAASTRVPHYGPTDRLTWLILAAILAIASLIPTSVAGVSALVAGGVLVGLAVIFRQARIAVLGGLALVVLSLAVTVVVAVGGDPVGLGGRSEARGELWRGAVDLVREEPWRGIGPGAFAERNPVTDDPDLRWAHHGYLQAAAELGLPGLGLSLAALGWAYGRLWMVHRARYVDAAVAAGAVTVVALHGTVDYVWHFPEVMLTLALLLGWATAGPPTQPATGNRSESGGVQGEQEMPR